MKPNELLMSTYKVSDQWPALKKRHLIRRPKCEVCGATRNRTVHHIKPIHLFPELELEPENLITLCEGGKRGANHHLFVGHLMDYMSYNANVLTDVAIWNERIQHRPNKKRLRKVA
jgi:hypothetical protein